jgi:hypothetical protein
MSLTLERTAHETSTTAAAAVTDIAAAAPLTPRRTPLGGSYVTRAGSADGEGTYVTTAAPTGCAPRGTYVTTDTADRAVGGYTDTHGAARA